MYCGFKTANSLKGYKVINGEMHCEWFLDMCDLLDAGWHDTKADAIIAAKEEAGLPGLRKDTYGRLYWSE